MRWKTPRLASRTWVPGTRSCLQKRRIITGMTYRVVLQPSEKGFAVSCPGLPGCWPQGDTEQEALANIQIAISEYLDVVTELTRGQDVREVEVAAG